MLRNPDKYRNIELYAFIGSTKKLSLYLGFLLYEYLKEKKDNCALKKDLYKV